jgi:hypothetical protein
VRDSLSLTFHFFYSLLPFLLEFFVLCFAVFFLSPAGFFPACSSFGFEQWYGDAMDALLLALL